MDPTTQIAEPIAVSDSEVWHWRQPLDVDSALAFHALALERMRSTAEGPIYLDLMEASHIDTCGLQLLVVLAVHAITRGRKFEISGASQAVESDLQLAGVAYLLRQETT